MKKLLALVCILQPPMFSKVCILEEIRSNDKICKVKSMSHVEWKSELDGKKYRCNLCVECE